VVAVAAYGALVLGARLLQRRTVAVRKVTRLTEAQRGAALQRVEAWLHEDASSPVPARGRA
jgi:hypothetical protein